MLRTEGWRLYYQPSTINFPQYLPHILDSFYRVSAARTPGENHIGLGLSITRRMLEAHGGELQISSEEGKGTNVTLLIPKAL